MNQRAEWHSNRERLAAWVFFACVVAAYSCVILHAKLPPPLVDYPDWVYQGVLLRHALAGHAVAGYALKRYPVPNSTTTVALGLLDCVLPWQWAAKLWIVLYLGLAGYSSMVLLRALQVRGWRLIVALPAIVFLNLDFWYGHIGFEVGLCLVFLVLAMLLREASSLALAAMLVLIFFTHMEACAAALLLFAIWCAVTQSWRRLWAAVPAVALTVWYAVGRFNSGDADVSGLPAASYSYGSGAFLVYKANTFLKVFGYVNPSTIRGLSESERMLGRAGFVLLVAASLVLSGLCLVQIVRVVAARHDDAPRRAIAWFALVLLGSAVVLPQIFLGVADPGSRLVLMAAAVALPVAPWSRRTGLGIACLSALLCLVNLGQLAQVESDPMMGGHVADLPLALLRYGHVEPAMRTGYYDELQRGTLNAPIFPTGIFLQRGGSSRGAAARSIR